MSAYRTAAPKAAKPKLPRYPHDAVQIGTLVMAFITAGLTVLNFAIVVRGNRLQIIAGVVSFINMMTFLISYRSLRTTGRLNWEAQNRIEKQVQEFKGQADRLMIKWPVTAEGENHEEDRSSHQ